MEIKFKKRFASESDKEFLYSLNKVVYQDLVERTLGEWDEEFQREYFELKWENSGYQIVEKDNKRIGTICVGHESHQHTLKEIQLLPEFQKQGIGTNLIKTEIKLAEKAKIPLKLSLLKGNKALSLYEKLGFRVYSETEKNILMEIDE